MKQKILISGLSLLLTFSLVGCGGQQAQQEPQEPDLEKVQQTEPASTTTPVESMKVKNETDTAIPLTELEDVEPEEADGAGTVEGAGSVETDLEEVQLFTELNETVYATGTVNLHSGPSTEDEKVEALNKGNSVTRIGIGTGDYASWSKVKLSDGTEVYVASNYLTTTKPVSQSSSNPSGGTQQQGGTGSKGGTGEATVTKDPYSGSLTSGSDANKGMITDPNELDTGVKNPYLGSDSVTIGYGGN